MWAAAPDFNRDIRPILSDNCFSCHGPDEKQRQVALRLDTKEGAFADRGAYRIIVPGDAARSRLYQKITAANPAERMPLGRSLTEKQIALIREWIDAGARWETHWAYIAPERPALPKVAAASWPRNAVDHFVLARLERERLKPSPEAGRATLIRRVTLDLTGLPPAPSEVDAFLADKSPDAYYKVVDRLLGSPRYGERMAMQWLDLARYADTHGYHIDSHRDMWRWRDWLVGAFNRNLPFDQFTIEQLAGDLLPGATVEQKIATGFNRNHMINFEGGAIPEEYLTEYVVDRVETTSTVWMGMTMGCARCHDHKYDPVSQKEFYQFYSFFNTIPEKGLDGRRGNAEPMLQLPSAGQKRRYDELVREIAAREKALPGEEIAARLERWAGGRAATMPEASKDGLAAHYEFDGHLADTSGNYLHGKAARGTVTFGANGAAGRSAEFDGEAQAELPYNAAPRAFSVALWARGTGRFEMPVIQKLDAANGRRGFEIAFDEFVKVPDLKRGAHLYVRLIHSWPNDSVEIKTTEKLIQSTWYHLAVAYDGSGKAAGLRLYVDGKPAAVEVLRDRLSGSIQSRARLEVGNKKLGNAYKGQLDDLRIYHRLLGGAEIEQLAIHNPVRATLLDAPARRSREQRDRAREYFLAYDAPERFRTMYAELKRLRTEKEELEKIIPNVMVMQEMGKPRETFVLERGDYRNQRDKVSPGVPAVLPPLEAGAPASRLTLARWLVDPAHPLTARVAVNRYWQMYFGIGLVKTAEDFGSQGEPPANAELLDWLAAEFVRAGWDVRAMQRLIVTSATYRQSSRATPERTEKDPENRLAARASRFRLPAEMVRDNALAIGGLLSGEMGGPGVFPYQPKGVWEDIAYGDVYSAQEYAASRGQDLYRRSLYMFWKRTAPPPGLITFDAPDREKCTARRAVTNTPLQALVLMNDPTYVEAARALAGRILAEAGGDADRRIALAFRLATSRRPSPKELGVLREMARVQLATFRRDPNAARKLLGVGELPVDAKRDVSELAAWTTVASAILNLDETITRE